MPSELFYHNILDCPFPIERVSGLFLLLPSFIEIRVFNANSVDPDHRPHSALYCLPISLLLDARYKRVKAPRL